jgi:hypothetical protein
MERIFLKIAEAQEIATSSCSKDSWHPEAPKKEERIRFMNGVESDS